MKSKTDGSKDWFELTKLTQGQDLLIERVQVPGKGIHIEGQFELPQLAKLTSDDQVFVIAFIRSHGSIKEMEQIFGVSYPTIKARLTRIAESLEFVEINPRPKKSEVLERLKRGEISVAEAIAAMEAK